jgi:transposase, IS5 family
VSAGVLKRQSLATVIVDTTVQPKAIAHPTDSRLLNRAREQLVAAAQDAGIELRQSYARVGNAADAQAGRCAHAQQWRRTPREVKKLRTWLGRVIRDVQLKAGEVTGAPKTRNETAQRLYAQRRDSKNKLYALHAPEVECIAKGKARTPYEFGVKTSVAVTAKEGVVVGMRSMPGTPYDGHTLHS